MTVNAIRWGGGVTKPHGGPHAMRLFVGGTEG